MKYKMHVLIFPCEHYVKNCLFTYSTGQFADSPTTFGQVVLQMTDVKGADYFPHTQIVSPTSSLLIILTLTSATLVPLSASLTQTSASLFDFNESALGTRFFDQIIGHYALTLITLTQISSINVL